MELIAINAFISLAMATLAAGLTYLLAVQKFKSERWWDLKVTAYQRIIEALHNSKEYASQHYDVALGVKELSPEKEEYLKANTLLATREIAKAVDIGTFVISEEALVTLEAYKKAIDNLSGSNTDSWFDYLGVSYELTNDCLKELRRLAKEDLQKTHL